MSHDMQRLTFFAVWVEQGGLIRVEDAARIYNVKQTELLQRYYWADIGLFSYFGERWLSVTELNKHYPPK